MNHAASGQSPQDQNPLAKEGETVNQSINQCQGRLIAQHAIRETVI